MQKQSRNHDLTKVLDFPVASSKLHANPMWKDLRKFYDLVELFEKLLKIKKAGYCEIDKY